MEQQTVILYPSPGVGHIVSMVQLAKVFLRRRYDVTMVIAVSSPDDFRIVDVDRVAACDRTPAITFHAPRSRTPTSPAVSDKHHFLLTLQVLRRARYNNELERFLRSVVVP